MLPDEVLEVHRRGGAEALDAGHGPLPPAGATPGRDAVGAQRGLQGLRWNTMILTTLITEALEFSRRHDIFSQYTFDVAKLPPVWCGNMHNIGLGVNYRVTSEFVFLLF